jgi:hypothetical protein
VNGQPTDTVERVLSVRSLQLLRGSGICRLLGFSWPVPASPVYTEYARVVGEPPWVDLVQDG